MRRVFFALWPNKEQQAALEGATHSARHASGGRVVPALNFHVTLVFVGSVAEVRMPDLFKVAEHLSGAERICHEIGKGPAQLVFDSIEYWKKPRVISATASVPSAAVSALSETLKTHLVAAGFTPDLEGLWLVGSEVIEEFRPHVTLARKVSHPIPTTDMDPVVWRFTEFALVDSRTEPKGSVYTVLQTFPLGARRGSDA